MSYIKQLGQGELPKTFVSKKELSELFEQIQLSEENARQWMEDIRRDPKDVSLDPWEKWV